MIEEELQNLRNEFKAKSKKLLDLYKQNPVKDGHIDEDLELRHWYEEEMKKIYKKYNQLS